LPHGHQSLFVRINVTDNVVRYLNVEVMNMVLEFEERGFNIKASGWMDGGTDGA